MSGIAWAYPHFPSDLLRAIWRSLLAGASVGISRAPRVRNVSDLVASLTDEQRSDLGFENPPLAPVSRFQDYELDTMVAKQSPDAMQLWLTRGLERRGS